MVVVVVSVYPKYYSGGKKCRWSLRAEPGQRIQLRFLDISLREGLSSRDPECSDSVRVSERGKTLLHMCGESTDDIVLLSQRSKLEVSHGAFFVEGDEGSHLQIWLFHFVNCLNCFDKRIIFFKQMGQSRPLFLFIFVCSTCFNLN